MLVKEAQRKKKDKTNLSALQKKNENKQNKNETKN